MFNFLKKHISVGLDISDYSIEIASLMGPIEKPVLLSVGRTFINPGIFEEGRICDKQGLAELINKLITSPKFGKIKTNEIVFSLPELKSYTHVFKAPENLKQKEISNLIKDEIAQNFPFPLSELYFDYQIFGKELILCAASRQVINDYLEVFKKCNLVPLAIEIESLSLARSLLKNEDASLIVDIGTNNTNFNVFENKRLKLSFSLAVGGYKFTNAVSKRLKISWEEAENLKKGIGLDAKFRNGIIFLVLKREVQEIMEEIKKIEKYYQDKTGKSITEIILAGGSALLPHLSQYLERNLNKKVSVGNPLADINFDYAKIVITPILFATCIGAGLRGLVKKPKEAGINLLSKGR